MTIVNPKVTETEWSEIRADSEGLWTEFAALIENGIPATSVEAQQLTEKLYLSIERFWIPSKYSFIGLAQLWNQTPEFQSFYAGFHPDLLAYLTDAMNTYAETKFASK